MTLKEFRWAIRFANHGLLHTSVVKGWMTDEQLEEMQTKDRIAERNAKRRNPSFWTRIFIRQAWQLMYPGEKEK